MEVTTPSSRPSPPCGSATSVTKAIRLASCRGHAAPRQPIVQYPDGGGVQLLCPWKMHVRLAVKIADAAL